MMKLITSVIRREDEYKRQGMRVITLAVLLAHKSTGKLMLKVKCTLLDGEAVNEKDCQSPERKWFVEFYIKFNSFL